MNNIMVSLKIKFKKKTNILFPFLIHKLQILTLIIFSDLVFAVQVSA